MLDKKEFEKIGKDLKKSEEGREDVIRLSRDIIQISKRIIYSVHRSDPQTASKLMVDIKNKVKKLKNYDAQKVDTNINSVAYQEYVEAAALFEFKKHGKVPTRKSLEVTNEHYLMGLCDLSGELVRLAVKFAINKKFDEVEKIRSLVDEIYGEFLKFDLRNGELRKKSDSIKWNLKKIEEINYDISLKK